MEASPITTESQVFETKSDNIIVECIKKTKKNEPKVFPSLMLVDREAFESCG